MLLPALGRVSLGWLLLPGLGRFLRVGWHAIAAWVGPPYKLGASVQISLAHCTVKQLPGPPAVRFPPHSVHSTAAPGTALLCLPGRIGLWTPRTWNSVASLMGPTRS